MPAPIAKGIIVVASVLVAASIALYENPQVRVWVDNSRRKIALALHSLGDEINPQSRSPRNSEDDESYSEEQRRRWREELVRRNRAELIRKAREEGIAVDLDELDSVGGATHDEKRPSNLSKGQSFDDLVGSDGMLRSEKSPTGTTTGIEKVEGLRQRGHGGHGLATGAAFANPFTDEAHVIFDQSDDDRETHARASASRDSTATLEGDAPRPGSQASLSLSVPHQAPQQPVPVDQTTEASFYSAAGDFELAAADDLRSNGTLTPTEGGFSTSASVAGSNNGDIGILSEVLSQGGFSEAGISDASFSDVGVSTPGSWTDIGSDAGSDDGFGHVSQQH